MPQQKSIWEKAVRFVKSGFRFRVPQGESEGSKKFAELLMAGGSMGFPGAWTADRLEQVRHYRGWSYIAIKAIAEEVACHTLVNSTSRSFIFSVDPSYSFIFPDSLSKM
jgi:hypothetical protein